MAWYDNGNKNRNNNQNNNNNGGLVGMIGWKLHKEVRYCPKCKKNVECKRQWITGTYKCPECGSATIEVTKIEKDK